MDVSYRTNMIGESQMGGYWNPGVSTDCSCLEVRRIQEKIEFNNTRE